MAELGKHYYCDVCGNEVLVTKAGGGGLVCCGKPMKKVDQAERIIISTILNRSKAWSECGSLAGIISISPFLTFRALPETVISASPSTICTVAS